MGFVHRAFVAAGVGFAVAGIAGCGSSGGSWLSQSEANRLTAQLNNAQQALDVGECARAQRYLTDFQTALGQFGGVNSTLLANLNQGASTVESLTNVSNECQSSTVTTPKTHTTKTRTSSTTTTTATETVPTFTEPTTTTPTQTYTYTQPSTSTTSTTGGQGIDTTSTAGTTTTTSSTTSPSGGTGLGDTYTSTTGNTTTGAATTTITTTGTSGSGF